MNPKMLQQGVKAALITALISGFAVFINKFAVSGWIDSNIFTTSRNIITALLLSILLLSSGRMKELKSMTSRNWLKLILIGLIGGSIPFLMFFRAVQMIPGSQAAFIHKTLFLWVGISALAFLKEKFSRWQLAALGLFAFGILLSGAPTQWSFSNGFWLALGATIFWAAEIIIAKPLLREISSITLGWGRMFFGSTFLLTYLLFTGGASNLLPVSYAQTGWMVLSGIILFGYVTGWFWALKNAPAGVVTSILVVAAPITSYLEAIFVTHKFPAKLAATSLLMALGILLISNWFGNTLAVYRQKRRQTNLLA